MGASDILRDALFGNPPSPSHQPSREGVLAAFDAVTRELSGALAGIVYYGTGAARAADTSRPVGTIGKAADEPDYYRREGAGWVVDNSLVNGLISTVQAIVDQATAAAATLTSALPGIIPLGTATVGSDPNALTIALPDGVTIANRQLLQFDSPATTTGAVTLTTTQYGTNPLVGGTGGPTTARLDSRLSFGETVIVQRNNGGNRWKIIYRSNTDLLARIQAVQVGTVTSGSTPAALAISTPDGGQPFVGMVVLAQIPNGNAAGATLNVNGSGDLPVRRGDGSNGPLVAGQLADNAWGVFVYVGGGGSVWVLVSPTPALGGGGGGTTSTVLPQLDAILNENRWGAVSLSGSTITRTPRTYAVTTVGNSVAVSAADTAREGGAPPGMQISKYFTDLWNAEIDANAALIDDNQAFGGKVTVDFPAQLAASSVGNRLFLLIVDGMNSAQVSHYYSGQGFTNGIGRYADLVDASIARDEVPILMTSMPSHPARTSFTYTTPTVDPVQSPNPLPVSETEKIIGGPHARNRDRTGSGTQIAGLITFDHWNDAVREIWRARRDRCVLWDVAWAFDRFVVEGSLGFDGAYTNLGDNHPNAAAYPLSYHICARQFVSAVRSGRLETTYFRGDA